MAGGVARPYSPFMGKTTTPSKFLHVRVTKSQHARLLNMQKRAGDPTPSITVRRILFKDRRALPRGRHGTIAAEGGQTRFSQLRRRRPLKR